MFSFLPNRNGAQGENASPKMFSEQDIHEIFEEFPPLADTHNQEAPTLPKLVLTQSGGGFVTAEHLFRSFEALVTKEKNRVPLVRAGHELDVDKDVVLRLVQVSPQLASLNGDQSMIITTEERASIFNGLSEILKRHVLFKSAYAKEHDVSQTAIDAWILSQDSSKGTYEADGHLIDRGYEEKLTTILKKKIETTMKDLEPLHTSSSSLPGEPPLWFIRRILDKIIDSRGWSSDIIFTEEAGSIQCTPKGSVARGSKDTIAQLEAGTLPYIDKAAFAERFSVIYTSLDEVDELLAALPFVYLTGAFAISKPYLSSRALQDLSSLETSDGYLDIGMKWFRSELPQSTAEDIAKALTDQAISGISPLPATIRRAGSILFESSSYDRDVETLFNATQQLAKDHVSKETPKKDLKFQLVDILHRIPPAAQKVVASDKDGAPEKLLVEHFWSVFSEAESQNELEFASFWIKRVVSRQRNYCEALEAIEDAKFRDQLADLLSTYIRKELVPDSLAKARTQGLIRSSKTAKNVQKLETRLSSDVKKDLASVISSTDKFEKKQEIHGAEPVSTEEAKRVLVGDMVRRMQKPKTDGPLLFLSLVVVLTSKHYPGVVYATGKFAPKLLKRLKSKVSGEDYEQLEKWKEMAKSGTLGADDQKLMAHMAEQA